ncbi:MAG: hypothetical protein QW727_03525, partial [Candidatus Pacearchaeota archaeon]
FAVIINPLTIEYFFSPDKQFDFIWKYFVIQAFDIFIFLMGIFAVFYSYNLINFLERNLNNKKGKNYLHKFFIKIKKNRKEIILLLFVLFISIIAAEIALRVLDGYLHKDDLLIYDKELDFILNKKINVASKSFMEERLDFTELNESDLIYAIGDSFAYGIYNVGYKNNYLTLIDDNLSNYNVVNLGVPQYQPRQYEKIIKKYSEIKKPRYIFLNFYVGNDFHEFSEEEYKNIMFIAGNQRHFNHIVLFILKNSFISKKFFKVYVINKQKSKRHNDGGTFSEEEYFQIGKNRVNFFKKNYSDIIDKRVNNSLMKIEEIIDFCERNNITLIVFILPDEYQINEELRNKLYSKYNLNESDYDVYKPQEILSEFLMKRKVDYIDLIPYFENETKNGKTLYALRDTHWNIDGNKFAAEIILRELNKRHLLK